MLRYFSGITCLHRRAEIFDARGKCVAEEPAHFHIHRHIGVIKTWNTTGAYCGEPDFVVRGHRIATWEFTRYEDRHLVLFRCLSNDRDEIVLPLGTHVALTE